MQWYEFFQLKVSCFEQKRWLREVFMNFEFSCLNTSDICSISNCGQLTIPAGCLMTGRAYILVAWILFSGGIWLWLTSLHPHHGLPVGYPHTCSCSVCLLPCLLVIPPLQSWLPLLSTSEPVSISTLCNDVAVHQLSFGIWHCVVLCVFRLYVLPVLLSLSSGWVCPCSWEQSLDGSLENRPFILLASASLVCLFSLAARADTTIIINTDLLYQGQLFHVQKCSHLCWSLSMSSLNSSFPLLMLEHWATSCVLVSVDVGLLLIHSSPFVACNLSPWACD